MKRFACFMLTLVMLCASACALADFSAGDIVTFGQIDQDNNNKNGKEDIEWIVLENDGEEMILLSRYVLTARPFNNKKGNIDYSKSAIRKWLNDGFIKSAFPSKEQKAIVKKKHDNSAAQSEKQEIDGQETEDRAYLLSYAEAVRYFPEAEDRRAVYTDAAIKAYSDGSMSFDEFKAYLMESKYGGEGWMLRTVREGFMGMDGYYPEVFQSDGEPSMMGASPILDLGVRPAVVVNLQKAEGLIDLVSNGKVTISKQKLCDTFYIRKVKKTSTPQWLLDEGRADMLAALIFLDAQHAAKKDAGVESVIGNVPIDKLSVEQPVYAGVTQKGNGFAAFPTTDGSFLCLSWEDKEIKNLGIYTKEEMAEVLSLMKQTAEMEWIDFVSYRMVLSMELGAS